MASSYSVLRASALLRATRGVASSTTVSGRIRTSALRAAAATSSHTIRARSSSSGSNRYITSTPPRGQQLDVQEKFADALPIFETMAGTGRHTPQMACFQCEQTFHGTGCVVEGVCGKTAEVAKQQDVALHLVKALAQYAVALKELGADQPLTAEETRFVLEATFATLTNVNFDPARWNEYIERALEMRTQLAKRLQAQAEAAKKPVPQLGGAAVWTPGADFEQAANEVGLFQRGLKTADPDVFSLVELLTYGLKGLIAYAEHAAVLEKTDPSVFDKMYEMLGYLGAEQFDMGTLLNYCLKAGEVNLRVMELLSDGASARYGAPVPTKLRTTAVKGKCVLVSGHDLRDLEAVLEATKDKGINVYTHGELLPAHGYPGLKKYPHLVGNYGGAWMLQKIEFAAFPGPILVTTNCILEPRKSYRDRIYSVNAVGYNGVRHLEDRNFAPLVQQALEMDGFVADEKEQYTTTGFGHNAVLGIADKVISAVKEGKIRHFFLIGGCDGSEGERNYYAELAGAVPEDCVILTLACGKYRFNKREFGVVPGTAIPRLLDVGQCNDAHSAIQIAAALAGAFKTDVNGLPLSFALSYLEQKATIILLSLLHLGVQNIRLGPRLPAFLTPNVLNLLVEKYNLMPVGDVKQDLAAMLEGK
ncbi:Hydroxylamine reductase [Porphyridium purpureum]|uniref:Hydroxylamine reductase n=1 Tax=Porphyridium purpureum TaxID=35688 RepID=A0A5J4Z238_PORPP|nr:Hydroxylamine reductase [Porphyridium purpureum]|eukprot:POR6028..scf208_2